MRRQGGVGCGCTGGGQQGRVGWKCVELGGWGCGARAEGGRGRRNNRRRRTLAKRNEKVWRLVRRSS
eukprot:177225-Pyramimonas_sp.AAC.1